MSSTNVTRKEKIGLSSCCFLEEKKGCFLFLKRSASSCWGANKWDLPGGKMDQGETPKETLKREVKEETGQTIKCPELVGMVKVKVKKGNKKINVLKLIYLAKGKGKIKINEENQECKILTLKEAKKLNLAPKVINAIKLLEKEC